MQLSVHEAQARFGEAADAAARGERVVVTRDGKPFVELVASAPRPKGVDWEKMARIRRELGLEGVTITLPDNFDDAAFSRQVLGLED